jgi:hypothetical protein
MDRHVFSVRGVLAGCQSRSLVRPNRFSLLEDVTFVIQQLPNILTFASFDTDIGNTAGWKK